MFKMCLISGVFVAQMSSAPYCYGASGQPDDLTEAMKTFDIHSAQANKEMLQGIANAVDQRISRLEYVVNGKSETNVIAPERVSRLEKEVFGPQSEDVAGALSLSERLDRVESTVTAVAAKTKIPLLPLEEIPVNDKYVAWAARLRKINAPVVVPQTKLISGFQRPGKLYGYPNIYRGPGLPPNSYGAYPGGPTWWNSEYRRSGLPFSTNAPYFPWAANRIRTR